MNAWRVFLFLGAIAALSLAAPTAEDEAPAKRQALATAAAVAAVTSKVLKGIGSLFSKLNGPNNVKDVVVSGRGYRITIHSNTSATVMDRNTGLTVTKKSTTSEAAVSAATSELVKMLIKAGYIDIHSVGLPPKDATLPPPLCKDKVSNCQTYIRQGLCTPHGDFTDFMVENCFYSCANCGRKSF